MIIKCLTENTSDFESIKSEHGLSLYIETEKHKILFDMGQTDIFAKNANSMGVDLKEVDTAIISHGHYDHGGGLKTFLEINDKAPVYISEYAFEPHYHGEEKYIGLNEELKDSPRLIFTEGEKKIDEGITLYSCNEKPLKYPINPYGLSKLENDKLIPDDFKHEQYLEIEENGKKYLFSGCSHKGILNIADLFSPDVLIGGFHFTKLNPAETEDKKILGKAAEELKKYDTVFYTCHCTGTEQYKYLKMFLNNQLHYLSAGQTLNFN